MKSEQKEVTIGVIRIQSWEYLKLLASPYHSSSNYLFRGQGDANWALSSRLERSCSQWGLNFSLVKIIEKPILIDFKRRAHQYIHPTPSPDSIIEWLALLQHHGGLTRLLDVTKSIYIAAFFAMENTNSDAAIWAFNRFTLIDKIRSKYNINITSNDDKGETNKLLLDVCEKAFNKTGNDPFVIYVEPFLLNQRLSIQQGAFLFPIDSRRTLELNLGVAFGLSKECTNLLAGIEEKILRPNGIPLPSGIFNSDIIKFILPRDIHCDALRDLNSMNINHESLFPGLDGLSRSLLHAILYNKYVQDVVSAEIESTPMSSSEEI